MTASGRRNPREPPEAVALRRRLERLEQEARTVQGLLEAHERRRQSDALLKGLLALALADLPLDTMLARFIEALTSLPWLALEQKGAIFLASEGGGVLELKAQRGLGPAMAARCARVPFGRCLCGRAAAGAQILFADHVDDRHEWVYDGMPPHGHYCVPIIGGDGAVRGLITLYLPEGRGPSPAAEEFLQSVASTLAGIVERRTIQLRLAERTRELEEANIALGVLVRQMDREKQALAEQIVQGVREQILPQVRVLSGSALDPRQRRRLEVLQSRIEDLARPLAQDLAASLRGLSAGEARVARLIMEGLRSKEIAALLNLSPKTVEAHRRNIRRKVGLREARADLRAFLLARRTP